MSSRLRDDEGTPAVLNHFGFVAADGGGEARKKRWTASVTNSL